MTRIAFIGLGAMGSRMARRFLDAGHELVVWNRTAEKAQPLVEAGATLAASPAQSAAGAEVVTTMVANPDALAAVTEGADGISAGVGPDATVIEMSTVGPAAIARLEGVLPDGTGLLDAPVLGSLPQAEAGALAVFAGGPAELVERRRPLLSTLGSVLYAGPLGSGAAAKLLANTTLFATLTLVGECVALADALGLSRDVAFEVLSKTPLAAQAERRREAVESGEYPVHFSLALARKDADLVEAAAAEQGLELRVARAARDWLHAAEEAGWGDRDYAEILEWIRRQA